MCRRTPLPCGSRYPSPNTVPSNVSLIKLEFFPRYCPLQRSENCRRGPPISVGARQWLITISDLRHYTACFPLSQASLFFCTHWRITIPPEDTFERLRYSLGGDRPSQSTHQPLSPTRVRAGAHQKWYFTVGSTTPTWAA